VEWCNDGAIVVHQVFRKQNVQCGKLVELIEKCKFIVISGSPCRNTSLSFGPPMVPILCCWCETVLGLSL